MGWRFRASGSPHAGGEAPYLPKSGCSWSETPPAQVGKPRSTSCWPSTRKAPPRVRGSRLRRKSASPARAGPPARAGKPRSKTSRTSSVKKHPHGRGEVALMSTSWAAASETPPRVRGSSLRPMPVPAGCRTGGTRHAPGLRRARPIPPRNRHPFCRSNPRARLSGLFRSASPAPPQAEASASGEASPVCAREVSSFLALPENMLLRLFSAAA